MGDNDAGAGSDAMPRSAPTLYNVSILNARETAGTMALRLKGGTAGTILNVLLYTPGVGRDVDDAATCTQGIAGDRTLGNFMTAGAAPGGASDTAATSKP